MKKKIEKALTSIMEARSICVLTGAGISAESGIRTFREAGGLWEEHPLEKVATPRGFFEDPTLVWNFYNARRRDAEAALPNAAHRALAHLEQGRRQAKKSQPATNGHANGSGHRYPEPLTILTQNIDGLHQEAGSQNVVELHGSLWKVRCTKCGLITSDHPLELPILPSCEECSALLRPHVVWFGENLDTDVLDAAEKAIEECDLFLVIGTSAIVQPAASYPHMAARRGVPVIEVNKEVTSVSAMASISLQGLAGEILPQIIPIDF